MHDENAYALGGVAGHAGLFRRIAETGLVASEYPPGGVPARHRFLNRNRIVGTATGGVSNSPGGTGPDGAVVGARFEVRLPATGKRP
mgnify:CR=1 FL=1